MASDQSKTTGETQSSRRVKYGTNVAIAIIAAAIIVILINVIGYKKLYRLRLDLTSSRRWSLSDQTRKVVKALDGEYRMVMLISQANEYHEQARDLIGEYGYLSGKLSVEEISPANEGHMLKFYGSLLARYKPQLKPLEDLVKESNKAAAAMRQEVQDHLALVRQVLDDPKLTDEQLKQFIRSVAQAFGRIDSQYEDMSERLTKSLESPLPDYSGAVDELKEVLNNYDKKIFAVVVDRFKLAAEQQTTPDAIKEQLLQLVQRLDQTRQSIAETVEKLQSIEADEEYDKLRSQIGPETVVLIGPPDKAPRVIQLEDMFKKPDMQQVQTGERPELTFLGEEKVTGALVAMSLKEQPLVVFVSAGQRPAIGRGGEYERVAQRLRNMNFEVREWGLVPRQGPYGQPMPPGPPPEPKPGQKAVWIVPPIPAPNPMQRTPGADAAQQVVGQLGKRLEAGDAVMVMLTVSPMAGFGMADPISEMAKGWGVTPQTDRVILRQIIGPDRRTGATNMMEVTQWPDETAITKAISGMPGLFAQASPLVLGSDDSDKIWPLAKVTGKGLWAEANLQTQDPKLKKDTASDSFTIAAAIEKDNNRLVVVCDPIWATDRVTGLGFMGEGTADMFGARYPANAELFVNSVFWLADLDQLIAAGARTQDIRRIEDISPAGLTALRWCLLVGIPLAIAAAGIGVWFVRRKG